MESFSSKCCKPHARKEHVGCESAIWIHTNYRKGFDNFTVVLSNNRTDLRDVSGQWKLESLCSTRAIYFFLKRFWVVHPGMWGVESVIWIHTNYRKGFDNFTVVLSNNRTDLRDVSGQWKLESLCSQEPFFSEEVLGSASKDVCYSRKFLQYSHACIKSFQKGLCNFSEVALWISDERHTSHQGCMKLMRGNLQISDNQVEIYTLNTQMSDQPGTSHAHFRTPNKRPNKFQTTPR